jgi:elongation factor Ts
LHPPPTSEEQTVSHITVQQLKELRQRTRAGMLDCRQALEQAEGNMEQAVEILRRQAAAEAAKRAARLTGEGQVGSYIHHDAKVGALVEVSCETDFVARTEDFRTLVRYVAEQVAATSAEALETEASLLEQPWIRDPSRTIGDLVSETSARVGENVRVRRFARFRIADV